MSFEAIVAAARRQDADALQRVLTRQVPLVTLFSYSLGTQRTPVISIDVRKPGTLLMTPAAELASEGNIEAVRFLFENGANADCIAFGYALGGFLTQAEIYQTQHGAAPEFIANGIAQREFYAQVAPAPKPPIP